MDQHFNFAPIRELTEGDPDFLADLLASYQSSFVSFPNEFRAHLMSGEVAKLRFAIHKVKASVRMIEATELDRLLDDAPRLATETAPENLPPIANRVDALCAELLAHLNNQFS